MTQTGGDSIADTEIDSSDPSGAPIPAAGPDGTPSGPSGIDPRKAAVPAGPDAPKTGRRLHKPTTVRSLLEWVLVLGGDQASSHEGRARVIPGIAVPGDAAVGVVVHAPTAQRRPRYRYLGGASARHTRFHRNMRMSPPELAQFQEVSCEETVRTSGRSRRDAGLTPDRID